MLGEVCSEVREMKYVRFFSHLLLTVFPIIEIK